MDGTTNLNNSGSGTASNWGTTPPPAQTVPGQVDPEANGTPTSGTGTIAEPGFTFEGAEWTGTDTINSTPTPLSNIPPSPYVTYSDMPKLTLSTV
ncbi:MAG TPA: hypothetical protein VGP47_08090, partial [Parachlamydiaceae bacterium]|nr:hypothetical protein [Parachlamydiaceae bacterium]